MSVHERAWLVQHMQGLSSLLAESVTVAEGRLHAQAAGWDTVHVSRLPAVVPRIGIGAILSPEPEDTGTTVTLTVRLLDSDGNDCPLNSAPVLGAEAPLRAQEIQAEFTVEEPGEAQFMFAITLDNLVFPAAGRYRFVATVDERAES